MERSAAPIDDGFTTKPGEWEPVGTRWTRVTRAKGRELLESQGIEGEVPVIFLVRFDAVTRTMADTDRIVFEGKIFNIKSVNELGRRDGVEIVAVAAT